jgi:hypothetical protein
MKIIVTIITILLLLLCNWTQAIVPINQNNVSLVKVVDFNHITKGKLNNESQIINLIEDLDIDSEEDNANDNDLKSASDNKYLFQNFGLLSSQKLNCLFNYKAVSNNYYTYFPSLCGNSNPIYIFLKDLRI